MKIKTKNKALVNDKQTYEEFKCQWTRFITSSTDKHYSVDSEDNFRSVTKNSSFQNYTHPDDHTIRKIDTPGFKSFTLVLTLLFVWIDLIVFQLKLMYNALFSDNARDYFKEMARDIRTISEKVKSQVTSGEEGIDFIRRFY